MRRLFLLVAAGIALALATGRAGASSLDRSVSGENVTLSLTSPFAAVPPGGCLPYRVYVRNEGESDGTWQLTARAGSNFSLNGGLVYVRNFTVPAHATASFDISIPLPLAAQAGGTTIYISFSGTGISGNNSQYLGNSFTTHAGPDSPFAVIGNQVLGSSDISALESAYKSARRQFYGTPVDATKLPEDWRAYSGVALLILKDAEWLALTLAQRDAVCGYVAQGGHLTLYTSADPATRAPQLQLPGLDGKPGPYGFGTVALQSTASFPVDAGTLKELIGQDHATSARAVDNDFSGWSLRNALGRISVSGALIFLFVIVFASLVGPINLFIFASGKNRFRLFWTTPLISIVASLGLVTVILITDGVGGTGRQIIACFSLPDRTSEAVIQEQVARTALLLSSSWHADGNYLITPISPHILHGEPPTAGHRLYVGRPDLADAADIYRQEEGEFSGNWFRSRNVSGQYLQEVRPSRATLTVLASPAASGAADPPVVLSSYPNRLDQVFVFGADSQVWTCRDLEPGRKTPCTPSDSTAFETFWREACVDAGGKLRPLLIHAGSRAGYFYATGPVSEAGRLPTLEGIRWRVAKGLYLGPWIATPATEAGP